MATRQNLIDTYNSNPTLQSKYTLPQYLALFDFSQTTTTPTTTTRRVDADGNDCTDGKIAGGLLGGGAAAAMSRGDGRWWAIPLGAVLGSRIGCEIDGG